MSSLFNNNLHTGFFGRGIGRRRSWWRRVTGYTTRGWVGKQVNVKNLLILLTKILPSLFWCNLLGWRWQDQHHRVHGWHVAGRNILHIFLEINSSAPPPGANTARMATFLTYLYFFSFCVACICWQESEKNAVTMSGMGFFHYSFHKQIQLARRRQAVVCSYKFLLETHRDPFVIQQ